MERGKVRVSSFLDRVWWERVSIAKTAAWERIWRRGSRREWRISRWRMKSCRLDWLREECSEQNLDRESTLR